MTDHNPSETDAETLFDALVDSDVLTVDAETDAVTTTSKFEDTRGIYYDTYMSISDADFHQAVADAFGFESKAQAKEQVEALGVTREEFVAYLTLVDELDGSFTIEERSRMASMVVELEPDTPVPEEVETLTDESYEGFLTDHDHAIVTVWKHHCDPCEAMKDDLDAILSEIPSRVAVGGIDGENAPSFRRAYGIDSAPAMVMFENGEFREGFTGRATPERVASACAEVYNRS